MMKIKKMFQEKKGSVLAFSLIIMFVLMIIAAGVATVSVKERKMSSDTGKSTVAFQVADGGAEMALEKIKDGWTTVDELSDPAKGGMTCVDGVISGSLSNGEYELTFEDSSGALIDTCDNTDTIASIKSVGKYGETHRAIEVAVAAAGDTGIVGGCEILRNIVGLPRFVIDSRWGNGCKPVGAGSNSSRGGSACDDIAATGYTCGSAGLTQQNFNRSDGYSCLCVKL